jgi:acetyl esterase/lipase
VLDIYYPENKKGFATIVWFHGGSLKGGDKYIPEGLREKNVAVVTVKYRLYPKVHTPVFIEDAAASVAWTFKNIEKYGGDPSLIFVSGHSAGGYLASMVGLDKKYLQAHDIDANEIAGLIPFSGQCITHSTIREENGIDILQPTIDEYAPLFHVRKDAPPLLLITGDRKLEIKSRYAENFFMNSQMKATGHKDTRLLELQGYGHGMVYPAVPILLREVDRITKAKKE